MNCPCCGYRGPEWVSSLPDFPQQEPTPEEKAFWASLRCPELTEEQKAQERETFQMIRDWQSQQSQEMLFGPGSTPYKECRMTEGGELPDRSAPDSEAPQKRGDPR